METPDAHYHVFVYGTLRPGGIYFRRLVEGHPVAATPAWVYGQLYALSPGYPGMTPGENRVEGDILSFDDSALLATLDKLEGYDPHRPVSEDFEYTRERCESFSPDGASLGRVEAYWILPSRLSQYNAVPVSDWDHLQE